MRVLHINNYRSGGGTERYIQLIVTALERRDCVCEFFVPDSTPGNHPLQALRNTISNLNRLKDCLQKFRPDVIHVHNILNFRLLKFIVQNKPCLKTIHEFRPFCTVIRITPDGEICNRKINWRCFKTGCFKTNPGSIYRFIADSQALAAIRQFPRVWVMSQYMRDLIEPYFPDEKIIQYPYFHDSRFDRFPSIPSERRVFAAGRLAEGKGFERLLDIISIVPQPVEIRIAGTGPLESGLRQQADALHLNVDFLGYTDPDHLHHHYAWAKVVAVPSDYPEPFGIVGLEAMGAGRPVVAFDVGGVREWLEDGVTGSIVARRDNTGFSETLNRFLSCDSLAEELGMHAWKSVNERFNSKDHIDQLISVYESIMENKTSSSGLAVADPNKIVTVPIEDNLDLHTFAPGETRLAVDAYLEAALETGLNRVRIIHGKGKGIQREIIQTHLKQHPHVNHFENARAEEGGMGATIVYLRRLE